MFKAREKDYQELERKDLVVNWRYVFVAYPSLTLYTHLEPAKPLKAICLA